MSVLDRIRSATPADDDRPLEEVLGLKPGDRFGWDEQNLTVGDETVPIAEVLRAMGMEPARTIRIEDLPT